MAACHAHVKKIHVGFGCFLEEDVTDETEMTCSSTAHHKTNPWI